MFLERRLELVGMSFHAGSGRTADEPAAVPCANDDGVYVVPIWREIGPLLGEAAVVQIRVVTEGHDPECSDLVKSDRNLLPGDGPDGQARR